MNGSTAVFLDKDGTLVEDVPYNVDPRRIEFSRGAAEGLRRLGGLGYRFIVVTNQSGVARGYFAEDALRGVERRLRELFREAGADLDGFYYCPHDPEGVVREFAVVCGCRKPSPGLLLRACREKGISPSGSWFVGDILNDVEAGRAAGMRTVLVDNGNETEWRRSPERTPDVVVRDLAEAAERIAAEERA
jgi:D-glycero-D-manno-heptose 1,7-bisphosphate phosphatase